MSLGHSHATSETRNEKPLWIALILTSLFLIAEVVGGLMTNSLALISDAAHMFTDAAALAVSLAAIRVGRRPADSLRTFGYYRFEILAAAFNAILLFMVALYILYEAYERLKNPPEIQSGAMLIIAVAIGLWVLPRTWVLLKASMNVLLEGVPDGMSLAEVRSAITAVDGVRDVHDFHVWTITSGKTSLTAHIVYEPAQGDHQSLRCAIRSILADKFDIHHSTIQMEDAPCEQSTESHSYYPVINKAPGANKGEQ